MKLDDFLAQCQPEPGATLLAPHLDERFEDPPLLAIGDPFAIVLDTDDHPLAMTPGLQSDLASLGGVAQGVAYQVDQDTLQLWLVGMQ